MATLDSHRLKMRDMRSRRSNLMRRSTRSTRSALSLTTALRAPLSSDTVVEEAFARLDCVAETEASEIESKSNTETKIETASRANQPIR